MINALVDATSVNCMMTNMQMALECSWCMINGILLYSQFMHGGRIWDVNCSWLSLFLSQKPHGFKQIPVLLKILLIWPKLRSRQEHCRWWTREVDMLAHPLRISISVIQRASHSLYSSFHCYQKFTASFWFYWGGTKNLHCSLLLLREIRKTPKMTEKRVFV